MVSSIYSGTVFPFLPGHIFVKEVPEHAVAAACTEGSIMRLSTVTPLLISRLYMLSIDAPIHCPEERVVTIIC